MHGISVNNLINIYVYFNEKSSVSLLINYSLSKCTLIMTKIIQFKMEEKETLFSLYNSIEIDIDPLVY